MERWLTVIFIYTLLSCQPTIDEQPQILELSIAGVPPENITIDQNLRHITVVLPPELPALLLATSFTLSRQAQVGPYWTEGKKGIDLTHYCPNLDWKDGQLKDPGLEISVNVSNKKQAVTYTIQLKSTSTLRVKSLTSPLVYDSQGTHYTLIVPVENYYGSAYIEYIAVTKSGSLSPNWIGPGGGRMENCAGLLNEISLSLSGYRTGGIEGVPQAFSLKPGLHDLDLRLNDGTIVHAAGAVLVK